MALVKTDLENKQNPKMKTLTKLVLGALLLTTTFAVQAGSHGSSRGLGGNGGSSFRLSTGSLGGISRTRSYVYRNPYAANPSESVRGYLRSSGTYVPRYVRTPANSTVTDNLSYRGYGTVRVPR